MDLLISVLGRKDLERHIDEFRSVLAHEPHEYWTGEHFLADLPMKFELSVAAFKKGKLAGYIIASMKQDGPYIHKFMVHPEMRGLSLGARLLDFFEKNIHEKGFSSVDLAVREENLQGIAFYERHGFFAKGRRKDKVDDSDLLLLRKEILIC